jgi:biopolymer transport protein TolR
MDRKGDDFVAEINVTPFVDVMLVLLVIFMVTAPMMIEGLEVGLPQLETGEILPTENERMVLTIRENGALFLDQYAVTLDDLDARLGSNLRAQWFIRADKNVPYGVVMAAMGKIRGAGISEIGLITVPALDAGSEGGADPAWGSKAENGP